MKQIQYSYIYYIFDEIGYVKEARSITNSTTQRIEFNVDTEYFIASKFASSQKNLIIDKLLYDMQDTCRVYLLQSVNRNKSKQETCEIELEDHYLNIAVNNKYFENPLFSKSFILFFGEKLNIDRVEYEFVILPSFNQNKLQWLAGYNSICMDFLYNDDYYCCICSQGYENFIHIFNNKFKLLQIIKMNIKLENYYYPKVKLSPSNQYLYYLENGDSGVNENGEYKTQCFLRVKELKKDFHTEEFHLEHKHDSFDLQKDFNISSDEFNNYYTGTSISVTDDMEIIYVFKNTNQIWFNGQNCSNLVKEKFGKTTYDSNVYKTLNDFSISITNAGISIYNSEVIYQLRIDHKNNKLLPIMKINFDLNKCSVSVNNIFCCRDPRFLIIQLTSESNSLLLIWDVNLNQEYKNFSCSQMQTIVLSKCSRTGILIMKNSYVNLDRGIINYHFNSNFDDIYYSDNSGLKINSTQNIFVCNGTIYCKESVFGCRNMSEILENKDDAIKEKSINFDQIKHQIRGDTLVHQYALDYEPLCIILDYFEEHNPEYLRTILLANSKKKSPLILAIEGKSPKNIELMFKKLARFKTDNYSSLFYEKFIDLLQMNLKAFHIYLESCFFQTTQMKSTKYLKLNSDSDPWFVTHSSCLIDRVFIEKYCSNDQKRIQEIERKKREEAEKIAAQQKLELQRQIEENKKEDNKEIPNDNNIKKAKFINKSQEELDLEKERKKQKVLDIKAIEFDWIFDNKKRSAFIKALSNTDDLELFSLNIIRSLIYFMWGVCWKYLMVYVFVPFAVYFSVFVVYVTYVHKNKVQNGQSYSDPYGIAQIILIIITLLFIVYQGFYEAKQIWFNKLNYILSFWNLVDLISLLLNLIICISDLAGLDDSRFVPLSAIAILFMYLKLFYFGRIFISTAAMVKMVIAIIYDMRYFLFVFLLACAGFGNCFFILAKNDTTDGIFTGNTYFLAFLYSYQQALGGFDVSAYEREDKHLLYFIWFFNTLILFIILLNMIVAVMGDTFDRVQETAVNNILKEIVSIMYENELLFNRNIFPKDSKYIIVIQEERAEEEVEITWDGKLKRIKKHLEGVVNDQNKLLKEFENHFESSFRVKADQRSKDIETIADKHFSALSIKVDLIDKLISKCINGINPEEKSKENAIPK